MDETMKRKPPKLSSKRGIFFHSVKELILKLSSGGLEEGS